MKRLFAVILILAMAVSLCACGEAEPSVADQMYEKYGALIDKLEAGDFDAAADSVFAMMPEGEKYSSVVGKLRAEDYEGIIAEVTEMMPVPPETVVEITPENFWDYYELTYTELDTKKDAQGNIMEMWGNGYPQFELKEEYSIDIDKSSVEIGFTGEKKCRKIESTDWSTGEYTLSTEYYDDIAQSILSYVFGSDCSLSVSESTHMDAIWGAKVLNASARIPIGFLWREKGRWVNGAITPDDTFDMYSITLENVEIVRAEGTLVILNG